MKMKYFLFVVLYFVCKTSFCQVKVYEDLNGKEVSREGFLNLRNKLPNLYAYRITNDTLITFLYKGNRDFTGKLNDADFLKLKSRYPFKEDNSPIVIQYFPGIDECSAHYIARRDEMISFLREKNRNLAKGKKRVYNVYKSNNKVERISEYFKWTKDDNGFIESLFFEYHFPCGSYVVINEDGNYRGFKGEYGARQIIEDYNRLK
jgi:hypothetical protein